MTQCDTCTACIGALRGGAGRDQRIVVCFDLQSVGQQAFLPHVRALVRTNGVRVGGGGRGAGCVVWCRERWTPRRDLMKPSRGLLKPARCAVALVQLAVPTGGLLQAIEAADIKRALRGSGTWGEGSGVRCGARLLEPSPRLYDRRNPGSGARHEIDAPPANACGAKSVCPAKYFSGLPILGRGNLVGGPPRCAGAQRRRVVSLGRACRRRPRSTRVGRCQARSDAVARGTCTRGGWGGRGSVGRCGEMWGVGASHPMGRTF